MTALIRHRLFPWIFLVAACAALVILWLPSLPYPVVSDTINYAFLGESIWTKGVYALHGITHTKFLPVYPFLSYPFVVVLGYSLGMKTASLASGMGVLIAGYALLRRFFSRAIAAASVFAILFNHGFIVMAMLGASDLLCTLFFLLSLLCYLNAGRDRRWYIACGLFLGLSLLTRYNVVPLFLFFPLYTFFARRRDLRSAWFWGGLALGAFLFSLWFIRKALLTGAPLQNDYTDEFQARTIGVIPQAIQNIVYYLDPFKNILPILFVSSLGELVARRGKPLFLTGGMLSAFALFVFWPVRNFRYAFPGYVILIAFGVAGLFQLIRWVRSKKLWASTLLTVLIVTSLAATHAAAICLYTYGECNAWWDRTIGLVPKNMGLTTEGFYAWNQAREYINAHLPPGALVRYDPLEAPEVFRSDLRITGDDSVCPVYDIKQILLPNDQIIYQTKDAPVTYVIREICKN